MLTRSESATYIVITTIAGCIGTIASIVLIWLIFDVKFENTYNVCIFGMSIGLFIYNICDMYFIFNKSDNSNIWLIIINVWSSIISYYLSSLISISVYSLLAYNYAVPWRDTNILIPTVLILFAILGIFLTVALYESENDNERFDNLIAYNLCSITIKLCLVFVNLVTYFLCEFILKKNYKYGTTSGSNAILSINLNRKYAAIELLVRKMRFYPVLQIVSIVPYYIWSFIRYQFTGFYVQQQSSKYLAIDIITSVCLLLDSFWMLLVYLLMNPLAATRLKKKLLCLRSKDTLDGLNTITIGSESILVSNNNAFSEYRPSNVLEVESSARTSNKTSNLGSQHVLGSGADSHENIDLSGLSDKDLIFLAEGREPSA